MGTRDKPLAILLLGSGGREHALAFSIARSPLCARLLVAPGNPGIAAMGGKTSCLSGLKLDDQPEVLALAQRERIDLVVCGPEAPLTDGLGDRLRAAGIAFFGPSRAAAEVEGSKAFAKALMVEAGIPTAAHGAFEDVASADAFIAGQSGALVVKADGLCAGKGVEVTSSHDEARRAVRRMLQDRAFGAAGAKVVIEERLRGREVSLLAVCDGTRFALLPTAEDHKTIFDGDRGPNTGGMGTYSPSPLVDEELTARIASTIFAPMMSAMARAGRPFSGLLYGGLMLTPDRGPMVIEWNCRFGDPETQVILPRLLSDLVPWLWGAATGNLPAETLNVDPGVCVCVVLAADGYPGAVRSGDPIEGLPPPGEQDPRTGVVVFHAGTALREGRLCTAGGRVLGVTAMAGDLHAARARAYASVDGITFRGKQYRRDIGLRA